MTLFSCLPSARNTSSPQVFLLRNHHLHVPKKENLVFRPYLPFLSLNHSKFTHPLANISSFADAEGGKEQEDEAIHLGTHRDDAKASEDFVPKWQSLKLILLGAEGSLKTGRP
ncbi:hypothetical protein HRI_004991900 [Hibiscus trionum]|uniref:Uncharacterized protein n=1 Tax=Hibiscus trionum TaxID=183268 RepID=A0A9W7MU36_HIBTR|nr:hypothetical protein HRI_004991900 [Hibiscus trionum]